MPFKTVISRLVDLENPVIQYRRLLWWGFILKPDSKIKKSFTSLFKNKWNVFSMKIEVKQTRSNLTTLANINHFILHTRGLYSVGWIDAQTNRRPKNWIYLSELYYLKQKNELNLKINSRNLTLIFDFPLKNFRHFVGDLKENITNRFKSKQMDQKEVY